MKIETKKVFVSMCFRHPAGKSGHKDFALIPKLWLFPRSKRFGNSTPSRCLQSRSARNQPIRRKLLILVVIGAVLSSLGGKKSEKSIFSKTAKNPI
jgi:hypothetical protein